MSYGNMYERIVPRSSTSYSQKLINQKTMNSHANAYERKAERLLPARSHGKETNSTFHPKKIFQPNYTGHMNAYQKYCMVTVNTCKKRTQNRKNKPSR